MPENGRYVTHKGRSEFLRPDAAGDDQRAAEEQLGRRTLAERGQRDQLMRSETIMAAEVSQRE